MTGRPTEHPGTPLRAPRITLALAFCLFARGALAQPVAPTSPPPATVTPTAQSDREAEAARAFSDAMTAWRAGDCSTAAQGFSRAMALLPHPDTRYNLARALECANELPRAIEEFEAFLRESGDANDRLEVTQRLATLRARPGEVVVTSDPLDAAVTVDDETTATRRTPCRVRLAPGAHVLQFDREGRQRAMHRVVVAPGGSHDVHVALDPVPVVVAPPAAPAPDRVLTHHTGRTLSGRLGLIAGFSVPRDRPVLSFGVEAAGFWRRSLSAQLHAFWIETDNAPVVVGADIGWVFPIEEVDLGVYLSGSALLACNTACREGTLLRDSEQFVGGALLRADVVLHPRLAVGLFGRAQWRNFDVTNSEALLASGGLSLSLFL